MSTKTITIDVQTQNSRVKQGQAVMFINYQNLTQFFNTLFLSACSNKPKLLFLHVFPPFSSYSTFVQLGINM